MDDQVSYHFATVKQTKENRSGIMYTLTLRQQPKQSRMCGVGEKADRRPIDPPPIVQLKVDDPNLPSSDQKSFLQNPYYFMYASLMAADLDEEIHLLRDGKTRSTTGSVVSSLYHLKDVDNRDAGFFVFPDLSVRMEGQYRLKLSLFEIIGKDVYHCKSIISETFVVYSAKKFPGMEESTFLSRSFAEQGLKIRIRKESRQRVKYGRRKESENEDTEPSTMDKNGKRARRDESMAVTGTRSGLDTVSEGQVPFIGTKDYAHPDVAARAGYHSVPSSSIQTIPHATISPPFSDPGAANDGHYPRQPVHPNAPYSLETDIRTLYPPHPSPTGDLYVMRPFDTPAMPERVESTREDSFGRSWMWAEPRIFPGNAEWRPPSTFEFTAPAKLPGTSMALPGDQAASHRDFLQNADVHAVPTSVAPPNHQFSPSRYRHTYPPPTPSRHDPMRSIADHMPPPHPNEASTVVNPLGSRSQRSLNIDALVTQRQSMPSTSNSSRQPAFEGVHR